MDPRPSSFLMYSHDGFGLGHIKRNFNIARSVIQEISGSRALLLTGHTSIPFHPIPFGIDFVKLPGIVKVQNEQWAPRSLPMEPDAFREFRAGLIRTVAEHFRPDIFLVDYVPRGVWGELIPTLEWLKRECGGIKIVLGLRDIIDNPETTRERWEKGSTYQAIRDYYDKILIYGSAEVYPTAEQYGLTGDLEEKVTYCGYLCSEEPTKSREWVRDELRLEKEKLIVITAGGGADAYPMMQQCIEAIRLLLNEISLEVLMITGPLMRPELISSLEVQVENLPVKVLTSSHGILNYMNAADALITMGSYNTMMEAVKLRKPTVVIPREGPSEEQKMRASLFAQLGYVQAVLEPSALNPAPLSEIIAATLHAAPKDDLLNMDGLKNAVAALRSLTESRDLILSGQ